MRNIRFGYIILFLMFSISSYAERFNDVRQMGNIWVVTIDKSGSMRLGGGPSLIAQNVYNRLMTGDCLSSADFSKDRFLFLTSGYSYSRAIGLGNELTRASSLGSSFIHATDDKLYAFTSKQECASHISRILAENNYDHQLSFVSQIRLFSIVHAVNKLKKDRETNSFNFLKILTITDDADQNDQWRTDYRTLKDCAPNKVKEVNDSTAKYIYNSINERGHGYLNEIFSDENSIPHLWVYQYQSKEQHVSESQLDLLSIKAVDGENFSAKAKLQSFQGNKICYYHIDSIRVNKKTFHINSSFADKCIKQCKFDNGLKTNKTTIWGYIQVEYKDFIFGQHYKTVPFVQKNVVASQKLNSTINTIASLIVFCVIALFIYFFVIRPRLTIFTIYSSLGKKTTLKRGFSYNWKGEYIPIQCYQDNGDGMFGVIVKKHQNIRSFKYSEPNEGSSEILICSRYLLDISTEATFHSTGEDLERIYFFRSADYSGLLREEYEKTVFYKLRKKYVITSIKWQQRLIRYIINVLNFFGKRYYYIIKNIKDSERTYISADSVLFGKRFIIEYYLVGHEQKKSMFNDIVQYALTHYYNTEGIEFQAILCSYRVDSNILWAFIQLDDYLVLRDSLRSVSSLIRFEQTEMTENYADIALYILHSLKKEFPHKHLGYFDVTNLSIDVKPLSFSIIESTAPGFISFIESTENPRVQLMYSPVKEATTIEKFTKPNSKYKSGYLYFSAVPIRTCLVNEALIKQLSKIVVRSEEKQPSLLKLMNDHFEYRNIKEKF